MKQVFFFTWIFFLGAARPVPAQDDVALFDFWQYYSDIENSLYKHFCAVAFDHLATRESEINRLRTKGDWLERQIRVRERLAEIAGPFPERTPLNVKITGTLIRDGYRIEKTIYESLPGYYVTGALYIPDGIAGKAPAIFYACGHSIEGFRAEQYQHICINLAKKGFVVFTIDPMGQGERYEYYDPERQEKKFLIPDHEHSYAGAQCLIAGYSTARYFIWDVIRGIDYLASRKEVDPGRLGMTGRSGGGNLTAYEGAMDDRLLAAAPECYITGYEEVYRSIGPQCAEQNLYRMIAAGLDHADFIHARAPKPTLLIATTRDFFSIQGARESYAEASRMYDALGAADRLIMVEDDTVHRSTRRNREAMYGFFQKYLDNPGNPEDMDVETLDPDQLWVTPTGMIKSSFDGESVFSLNKQVVEDQVKGLEKMRADPDRHLEWLPSVAARYAGFESPESHGAPVFSGRYVKPGYQLEKYLLPGSGKYMLPVVLFKPEGRVKDKAILVLDTEGMEHAADQGGLAHGLLAQGYTIILADLPGIGCMGPGYLKGDSYIDSISYNQWFAAVLAGKSHVGLRAEDIIRIVRFTESHLSGMTSLSALAVGPLGSELLHAAVLEPRLSGIILFNTFLAYAEIAGSRFYEPGFVPHTVTGGMAEYDLPDLVAGLCPRKVLILDPVSADGSPAEKAAASLYLRFATGVYARKQAADHLQLISTSVDRKALDHILEWLER
jgi:dienelactone hydrolase